MSSSDVEVLLETILLGILPWVVVMGGIGLLIGERKGSRVNGFALGFFLGPVGWIIAALLDFRPKCPTCDQHIGNDARVCPWCGTQFID